MGDESTRSSSICRRSSCPICDLFRTAADRGVFGSFRLIRLRSEVIALVAVSVFERPKVGVWLPSWDEALDSRVKNSMKERGRPLNEFRERSSSDTCSPFSASSRRSFALCARFSACRVFCPVAASLSRSRRSVSLSCILQHIGIRNGLKLQVHPKKCCTT